MTSKEDNANAKHVFYIKKIYDGKDEDGNDKFVYKNGITRWGLWNETNSNILHTCAEIVFEKRFVDAESFNSKVQMAITRAGLNIYSLGRGKRGGSLESSGYTEIVNKDIFAKDNNRVNYFSNLQKSKTYQKI